MDERVSVVKISKKDIPELLLLLRKVTVVPDEGQLLNVLTNRMESPYFLYLTGKIGERIVGIMETQYRKEILLTGPVEYGYIPTLYVLPEARKRGVANRMLELAVLWLQTKGAHDLWCFSGPEQEGLNPFLHAQGFRPNAAKFVKTLSE